MPPRLPKVCSAAGCSKTTTDPSGKCPKHKKEAEQKAVARKKQYDASRPSASKRGYNGRWRKAREGFLRKHPLCAHCLNEGKAVPATVVDHIKPHKGDMALFWDRNNWQPLCKRHHDIKTATEDGGWSKASAKEI